MMNSKSREGRLALAGLMVAVVVTSIGATPPLNPLVIRADQQRGAVPAECDDSLAPAPTPRVDVRQIPLPPPEEVPAAPPSASLRDALRATQEALARNDRAAFDAGLAHVRSIVRDYPSGAEKRSADDLLAIYNDIERMWNAQYESPFFAGDSGEYAIASRYPGWEEAVRRSILTDARGARFYPAGETREFIARAAALRLSRLGVSAPYPAPRTRTATTDRSVGARETTARPRGASSASASAPRATAPRSAVTPAPGRRATTSTGSTTARSTPTASTSTRSTSTRSTSARSTSTTSRTTPQREAEAIVADASPRETSSATSPGGASPTASNPAAAPPPATASAASSETSTPFETAPDATSADPASATDSPFSSETALTTDSASTTTPATSATANDTAGTTSGTAATPRGRSVILPLILILIGLGVLVVLFRMSN